MLRNKCPSGVSLRGDFSRTFLGIALRKNIKILYNINNRRYEQAGHASGGPFFSALPEKKGEKRGAGLRLVRAAGMVQAGTDSSVVTNTLTHLTGAKLRAACYGATDLWAVTIQYLRQKRSAFKICKAVRIRRKFA